MDTIRTLVYGTNSISILGKNSERKGSYLFSGPCRVLLLQKQLVKARYGNNICEQIVEKHSHFPKIVIFPAF